MAQLLKRISLVIPAYNEQAYLPRLLESVAIACERYRGGAEAIEVIVADNASTDRTAEIACAHGCAVVPVAKRCIAAARNGGAAIANGEIFCFIDADSRIDPETFNAIDAAMQSLPVAIGATGVLPDRYSLGIRVTVAVAQVIAHLAGMDAGVVFCRREDFTALGGYDESRPVAEDVDLMLRMKAYGRKSGRRFVRLQGVEAITSTRKFDDYGDWHFLPTALHVGVLMLFDNAAYRRKIKSYWYERR
jgi:glycosyltransferase involved in cell wall biosynthesis